MIRLMSNILKWVPIVKISMIKIRKQLDACVLIISKDMQVVRSERC